MTSRVLTPIVDGYAFLFVFVGEAERERRKREKERKRGGEGREREKYREREKRRVIDRLRVQVRVCVWVSKRERESWQERERSWCKINIGRVQHVPSTNKMLIPRTSYRGRSNKKFTFVIYNCNLTNCFGVCVHVNWTSY